MDEVWDLAPPGELRKHARLEQSRIYRRQLLVYGSTGLATCIVGLTGFQLMQSRFNKGEYIAGIYCLDVRNKLEAYHKKQLSTQLGENIRLHIEKCSACKAYDEKHFQQS